MKKATKEKISIISDPALLVCAAVLMLAYGLGCMWVVISIGVGAVKVKDDGGAFVQMLFIILYIMLICGFISTAPRWASFITIDTAKGTVEFKTLLRKGKVRRAEEYRYIYKGSYNHGSTVPSLSFKPKYIVISTSPIEKSLLYSVNRLSVSEELLLIKFTPERWELIKSVCNSNKIVNNL